MHLTLLKKNPEDHFDRSSLNEYNNNTYNNTYNNNTKKIFSVNINSRNNLDSIQY